MERKQLLNGAMRFQGLAPGWRELIEELWSVHGSKIDAFLEKERRTFEGVREIYPPADEVFAAFCKFPRDRLRVVILGQDPYIHRGEAHGLAFSVKSCLKMPPSLRNIFKEVQREYGGELRTETNLSDWAEQGVLLLNTALTVREMASASHTDVWRNFTNDLIGRIGKESEGVVFMLWGAHAHGFEDAIDAGRNLVLKHSHPSPLSRRPFLGCGHFRACNQYLAEKNGGEGVAIVWQSQP